MKKQGDTGMLEMQREPTLGYLQHTQQAPPIRPSPGVLRQNQNQLHPFSSLLELLERSQKSDVGLVVTP